MPHTYDAQYATMVSAVSVDGLQDVVTFAAPVAFSAVSVDDSNVVLKSAAHVVEFVVELKPPTSHRVFR